MAGRLPRAGHGRRRRHRQPAVPGRLRALAETPRTHHAQRRQARQVTATQQRRTPQDPPRQTRHRLHHHCHEQLDLREVQLL